MKRTVNVEDPAEVAVWLLDVLDNPSTKAGSAVINVLRMCQLHGTSLRRVGALMDLIPLERAFMSAPAVEPER